MFSYNHIFNISLLAANVFLCMQIDQLDERDRTAMCYAALYGSDNCVHVLAAHGELHVTDMPRHAYRTSLGIGIITSCLYDLDYVHQQPQVPY
jgi:hypothetical protein